MQRVGQQPHSSPLQRPQTHLLRREGAKIRCRTLGSCSLHPSSVPALGTRQYPAVPSSLIFHSSRLKPDREFISTVEGPWDSSKRQAEAGRNPASLQTDSQKREEGHAREKYYRSGQKKPMPQPSAQQVSCFVPLESSRNRSAVTTPRPNTGLQLPRPDPVLQLEEGQLGVPAPPPQAGRL